MNKDRLLEALGSSVRDLQQRVDRHFDLVDRVLEGRTGVKVTEEMPNSCTPISREHVLKNAIREAIDTLEETRKAFKSKTLETLRKKLTRVLIDLE
jgi:hypothetical protein